MSGHLDPLIDTASVHLQTDLATPHQISEQVPPPLFPSDVLISDLLGRIVGCTTDTKLGVGGPVVEIIDLVIDRVVLAVSVRSAFGAGLEPTVFNRVVIGRLRIPTKILADVLDFN